MRQFVFASAETFLRRTVGAPQNAAFQLQAVNSKARESALCRCILHAPNCDDFLNTRA